MALPATTPAVKSFCDVPTFLTQHPLIFGHFLFRHFVKKYMDIHSLFTAEDLSPKSLFSVHLLQKFDIEAYYVFHDCVTLFFADNFSTECRITIEILHNFF